MEIINIFKDIINLIIFVIIISIMIGLLVIIGSPIISILIICGIVGLLTLAGYFCIYIVYKGLAKVIESISNMLTIKE
jgi:hypothetical protein